MFTAKTIEIIKIHVNRQHMELYLAYKEYRKHGINNAKLFSTNEKYRTYLTPRNCNRKELREKLL